MDAEGSYWFLEHPTTAKKIILQYGENTLGRHSSCKPVLKDYDFLSRRHAIINITGVNNLNLQVLNALNGVFINGKKLTTDTIPLSAGDIIGLGVAVENPGAEVPKNYGMFVLKQVCPREEDVVILSDDEDDVQILETVEKSANNDEIKMDQVKVKSADKSPINSSAARNIHLPILPDLKQELLTQTSKEIEDLFGQPDEELLESVYQINPYVCKQLNSKNIIPTNGHIHDGDLIEVPDDTLASKMPAPQVPPLPIKEKIPIENEDDDYDEYFAMSQAVLREMKDEAADVPFDPSEEDHNLQFEDDFEPPAEFKTAIATEFDDDEIILIEDDDDEFYDKAAGWSSKLLSQNVMSQIYPLDENDQSSDEEDAERQAPQLFNDLPSNDDSSDVFELPISMRRRSTALRIDSSSSEDELISANHVICTADSTTSDDPKLSAPKDCMLELSNNDFPIVETKQKSKMGNRSKSCYMERPLPLSERSNDLSSPIPSTSKITISESSSPIKEPHSSSVKNADINEKPATAFLKNNENVREILIIEPPHLPKHRETKQQSKMRKRSKSCYMERPLPTPERSNELSSPIASTSKTITISESTSPIKEPPSSSLKNSSTQQSKMRKRSKSCYMEPPLPTPERSNELSSPIASTSKTITISESTSPIKEPPSSYLKNSSTQQSKMRKRSKSCYMERPLPTPERSNELSSPIAATSKTITTSESTSPINETHSSSLKNSSNAQVNEKPATAFLKNNENVREILIIEPPHLPKHRGKLRGVSAVRKEASLKNIVLEKQRMLNYQAEMKDKWYQKPKDKRLECEEIKQKRREQLKKLAEGKKTDLVPDPVVKRTQTSVPTLGNCNRGEFLTKEIQLPINKKPKLDILTALPRIPKLTRRATIESFSQQLNAGDVSELTNHSKRLPERKDAQLARNQRTCNRVTFADMDRDFELRQKRDKDLKRNRHVRFNDHVGIRIIERVEGADIKVGIIKDTPKLSLSTYSERRDYFLLNGNQKNLSDIITGDILEWGNQWLLVGNADEVAEAGVLVPIPTEFKSYKQYKDIIIPLMKIELLATIERDYKSTNSTFDVHLQSHSKADSRNRARYVLVTRYNQKFIKKFDLYTLRSGNILKETFASMPATQRIAENIFELTFEILQTNITVDMLDAVKSITVRPVIDNIKVEMGAFNAVHQLQRSPLFQRILQPSYSDLSCDNKTFKNYSYKGYQKLNEHQKNICLSTWHRLIDDSSPSITLIQGPPGTGKSELIANLTLQCMYGSINHILDRKILICAHSNTAVDNITSTLNRTRKCMRRNRFQLLRFGIIERMDPNVHEVSLNKLLTNKCAKKLMKLTPENIESLKMQEAELKKEISDLTQRGHQVNYINQLLQTKQRQLRLISNQLNPRLTPREEWDYSRMYLKRANIVCTTLSSCVKMASYVDYFDTCIIDEATQCTEPWTLLPLSFGVKDLVLVGDTQQLPATVFSKNAIDCGLNNSMFDRIQRNLKQQMEKPKHKHFVHTKIFKLTMQYRMHPDICKWPNSYFYENQLENAEVTQQLHSAIIPYCVINLSYTRDTNDLKSHSISNDEEACFVAKLLTELDKHMPTKTFKYGLITPYSNQCYALNQAIPSSIKITAQTVDSYQGQQRDVVILSNARTRGVGFLTNYQRLNVALTRPRRCLIICGNFVDLEGVDLWRNLLNDARERQVYFDLQRNDVEDLQLSLINKLLSKPIEIE